MADPATPIAADFDESSNETLTTECNKLEKLSDENTVKSSESITDTVETITSPEGVTNTCNIVENMAVDISSDNENATNIDDSQEKDAVESTLVNIESREDSTAKGDESTTLGEDSIAKGEDSIAKGEESTAKGEESAAKEEEQSTEDAEIKTILSGAGGRVGGKMKELRERAKLRRQLVAQQVKILRLS